MIDTSVHGDPDAAVRREFGRQFAVDRLLHRGPLSAVYLARDAETGKLVALKTIPRLPFLDAGSAERFHRQAVLAARLDYPHVVPVRRHGASPSFLWYSMDYCPGGSLRPDGAAPMSVPECVRAVQQIASALDYAHRRRITHGDLRPGNVLLDESGWARVADFGMLRALGGLGALEAVEWPPGALDYVAPEQLVRGRAIGPACDQYALAVLTYECLAGKPPFGATSVEDLAARRRAAPPPDLSAVRRDVPPHLADAVRRAMSGRPAERYASVLDFCAVLSGPDAPRVLWPDAGEPDDDEAPPPVPRHRRRHRWLAGAAAALLVFGAGIAWLVLTTPPPPPAAAGPEPAPYQPPAPEMPRAAEPEPSRSAAGAVAPDRPAVRPAPAPGRLVVSSMPWAELSVDGRPVGNTPVVDLPVPAGEHRLRLTRDGFEPHEQVVVVATGETLRLTGIVLREVQP